MERVATLPNTAVTAFAVGGMSCGRCIRRVEAALRAVPGVARADVDLVSARATVERDPAVATEDVLRRAVATAGYSLNPATAPARTWPLARPVGFGLVAAFGLIAFYLGLITLAQGWAHAAQQLREDLPFVGVIVAGFGAQVGLFTALRAARAQATAGGMAASTGTSTAAMLACCAHHLAEVLPIVGLTGAAVVLLEYKMPLLWLGLLMNAAGVVYLAAQVRQAARSGLDTTA